MCSLGQPVQTKDSHPDGTQMMASATAGAIGVYTAVQTSDNHRMYYACRRCGFEEPRGILPTVSCGLLLALWGGICASILFVMVRILVPGGLGWWWWLVAPAILLFSLIPGAVLLQLFATIIEWLAISVFPCKKCKSHKFSFGKTHGFGL